MKKGQQALSLKQAKVYLGNLLTLNLTYETVSIERIALSSQLLVEQGGEVVVMSENDSDTVQGIKHQFFVIWKFPTDELAKAFETLGLDGDGMNTLISLILRGVMLI
ncbi:DUF6616 family protein [Chryseobacterium paludis]|uniref:DUF6616 family protein n=1 Tax=Chryseobacterium paludis TaxID=2956784 RepID=UPI0021BF176E|nr:DUF6616 family protein [Chryseobacterium paludis]